MVAGNVCAHAGYEGSFSRRTVGGTPTSRAWGEEGDNYDTSSFKVSVKVNGAAELGVV